MSLSKEERDRLITEHLGLVGHIAKRYVYGSNDRWDYWELFEAGQDGLINAAKHFDPERGKSFTSYAGWLIERRIEDEIRKKVKHKQLVRKLFEFTYTINDNGVAKTRTLEPDRDKDLSTRELVVTLAWVFDGNLRNAFTAWACQHWRPLKKMVHLGVRTPAEVSKDLKAQDYDLSPAQVKSAIAAACTKLGVTPSILNDEVWVALDSMEPRQKPR